MGLIPFPNHFKDILSNLDNLRLYFWVATLSAATAQQGIIPIPVQWIQDLAKGKWLLAKQTIL